jgi:hypothetical protein
LLEVTCSEHRDCEIVLEERATAGVFQADDEPFVTGAELESGLFELGQMREERYRHSGFDQTIALRASAVETKDVGQVGTLEGAINPVGIEEPSVEGSAGVLHLRVHVLDEVVDVAERAAPPLHLDERCLDDSPTQRKQRKIAAALTQCDWSRRRSEQSEMSIDRDQHPLAQPLLRL